MIAQPPLRKQTRRLENQATAVPQRSITAFNQKGAAPVARTTTRAISAGSGTRTRRGPPSMTTSGHFAAHRALPRPLRRRRRSLQRRHPDLHHRRHHGRHRTLPAARPAHRHPLRRRPHNRRRVRRRRPRCRRPGLTGAARRSQLALRPGVATRRTPSRTNRRPPPRTARGRAAGPPPMWATFSTPRASTWAQCAKTRAAAGYPMAGATMAASGPSTLPVTLAPIAVTAGHGRRGSHAPLATRSR
jgi:hypothetical protein